jgi:hypothetical protein
MLRAPSLGGDGFCIVAKQRDVGGCMWAVRSKRHPAIARRRPSRRPWRSDVAEAPPFAQRATGPKRNGSDIGELGCLFDRTASVARNAAHQPHVKRPEAAPNATAAARPRAAVATRRQRRDAGQIRYAEKTDSESPDLHLRQCESLG